MYLQTSRLQYNLQKVGVFQTAHSNKNIQAEACRNIIPQKCEQFKQKAYIRTLKAVWIIGFQDRLVMTASITLRVFNFIKNRNPSQGKLRENCEKRFSQSASEDAKNPIKSRAFKKLHKQTKEVFKAAFVELSVGSNYREEKL